jgi:hypothetical protein
MRTREQIEGDAKFHSKGMPGISTVTYMLKIVVEVLLDIREEVKKS